MSYLKFDKTLMTNLEEALPREILRTNREPIIVQLSLIATQENITDYL